MITNLDKVGNKDVSVSTFYQNMPFLKESFMKSVGR